MHKDSWRRKTRRSRKTYQWWRQARGPVPTTRLIISGATTNRPSADHPSGDKSIQDHPFGNDLSIRLARSFIRFVWPSIWFEGLHRLQRTLRPVFSVLLVLAHRPFSLAPKFQVARVSPQGGWSTSEVDAAKASPPRQGRTPWRGKSEDKMMLRLMWKTFTG